MGHAATISGVWLNELQDHVTLKWDAKESIPMVAVGTGVPSGILHSIHESRLKYIQSKQVQQSKSCGSFAWSNTALKAVSSLKWCNLLLFFIKIGIKWALDMRLK